MDRYLESEKVDGCSVVSFKEKWKVISVVDVSFVDKIFINLQ